MLNPESLLFQAKPNMVAVPGELAKPGPAGKDLLSEHSPL